MSLEINPLVTENNSSYEKKYHFCFYFYVDAIFKRDQTLKRMDLLVKLEGV